MSSARQLPLFLTLVTATLVGCASEPKAPDHQPALTTGGPAASVAATPFMAGAAVRAFTPAVGPDAPPVRIAGFGEGRDATGVHDDLEARALVIEGGGVAVAMVALDIIGLFHDDVVRIREEVRARHPEVVADAILVASTHTHAGPDIIGLWSPADRTVDPALVARIRSAAADAVAEAWGRRRQARVSFASADLPQLIHDSRQPEVIDATAFLMKVDSADGRDTIATLLDFPSHPESLGRRNILLSADYPWAARRRLEQEFGGVALFFSGDLGGMLTPSGVSMNDPLTGEALTPGTPRTTQAYGEELARKVIAAWRATQDASPTGSGASGASARGSVEVRSRALRVPLANQRFRDGLQSGHIWPRAVGPDGALTSEVALLTIHDAAGGPDPLAEFACVPGEIYPELVIGGIQTPQESGADLQDAAFERPLRPMMAGRYRLVLGLCNDELGYIIPKSEWDEVPPFAYQRSSPQYGEVNSAGPDVAPTVLDAFAEILRNR
jgi:hypothetical protein